MIFLVKPELPNDVTRGEEGRLRHASKTNTWI